MLLIVASADRQTSDVDIAAYAVHARANTVAIPRLEWRICERDPFQDAFVLELALLLASLLRPLNLGICAFFSPHGRIPVILDCVVRPATDSNM